MSMPLKVDADGSFDRRRAFPSGSNSVEVRNVAGRSLGWLSIAPRMRAVVAWSAATLTEDAG